MRVRQGASLFPLSRLVRRRSATARMQVAQFHAASGRDSASIRLVSRLDLSLTVGSSYGSETHRQHPLQSLALNARRRAPVFVRGISPESYRYPHAASKSAQRLRIWKEMDREVRHNPRPDESALLTYINLKLAALGQPTSASTTDAYFMQVAGPLLRNHFQKDQLLGERHCPADARVQSFLVAFLADVCPGGAPKLPLSTFTLDRPGIARALSLPATADSFESPHLRSSRQTRNAQGGVCKAAQSRPASAEGLIAVALHCGSDRRGKSFRIVAAASARVSCDCYRPAEDYGGPVFRSRHSGQQPRFRRGDLRKRRRSLPPREQRCARCRTLDGAHRVRDSRSA